MPEEPVGPRKKLNVALAGALGLMVGVFGAFFLEFLEEEDQREEGEKGRREKGKRE